MNATHLHDPYLDQLAFLISEHGIRAFESDVARLALQLRAAGFGGAMVDLLVDRTGSTVARERAFGVLVGYLTTPNLQALPANDAAVRVPCAA